MWGFCLFSAPREISHHSILDIACSLLQASSQLATQLCWVLCSLLLRKSQYSALRDTACRLSHNANKQHTSRAMSASSFLNHQHQIIVWISQIIKILQDALHGGVFALQPLKISQISRFWTWLSFLLQAIKVNPYQRMFSFLFSALSQSKLELFHMMAVRTMASFVNFESPIFFVYPKIIEIYKPCCLSPFALSTKKWAERLHVLVCLFSASKI